MDGESECIQHRSAPPTTTSETEADATWWPCEDQSIVDQCAVHGGKDVKTGLRHHIVRASVIKKPKNTRWQEGIHYNNFPGVQAWLQTL